MRATVAIVLSALLLSGCGGSPQASGSSPPTATIGAQPSPSAPAPSGGTGTFTVCPTAVEGPVCPLEPGSYAAAVHDPFSFSITEAGWQEERAEAGEFETRVVLSRVEDPRQRLTFLSGSTGAATRELLNPAAFNLPYFKAGQPTALTIAGTAAQYIDLEPTGGGAVASLTIDNNRIALEPDHRYRFTVARIPMGEESATVIMVTEAPVADFPTFVTLADRVLQTVKF